MLRSPAGMAILFTFYLIIALATHNALGAADIRLAACWDLPSPGKAGTRSLQAPSSACSTAASPAPR